MSVADETRHGGCACGAVRFVTRGPHARAGLCHCMTCRKAHGSAFNPFVVFGRHQVEVTGEVHSWDSSPGYTRSFCPVCGSRVFGGDGEEIEISLGSFDAPSQFEPQYESWTVRREDWLRPLAVPQHHHDRSPGA